MGPHRYVQPCSKCISQSGASMIAWLPECYCGSEVEMIVVVAYNDRVGTYTGIIASRYSEGFLGPLLVVQFDIRNFSSKKLS